MGGDPPRAVALGAASPEMILDRRALLRGLHWGSLLMFVGDLLTTAAQYASSPQDAPLWLFVTAMTVLTVIAGWQVWDARRVSERRLALRTWVGCSVAFVLVLLATGYLTHPTPALPSLFTPVGGALGVAGFAFTPTVGRWLTMSVASLLVWSRWSTADHVPGIASAVVMCIGGLTAATVIGILLRLADRIQRSQEAMWDEREDAARTSAVAASKIRWDGLIHDKVLAALRLAGQDGTPLARAAAAELAGQALGLIHPESPARPQGGVTHGVLAATAETAEEEARGTGPVRRRASQMQSSLERLALQNGLRADCVVTGEPDPEFDGRIGELLAAAGEALANVAAHAGVSDVQIRGQASRDLVAVSIRDLGKGFDPGRGSWGRAGIARSITGRMATVGGRASVESSPGAGTTVTLSIGPPADLSVGRARATADPPWRPKEFGAVVWFGVAQGLICVVAGWDQRHLVRSQAVLLAVILATQLIGLCLLWLPLSRIRVVRMVVFATGAAVVAGSLNIADPATVGWHYWFFGALMPAVALLVIRFSVALGAAACGAIGMGLLFAQALSQRFSLAVFADTVPALLWLAAAVWGVRWALNGATASLAASSAAYGRLRLLTARMEEADRVAVERSRRVGARVGEMLVRIAAGDELSRADRRQCLALEAETRDGLVAHHLATPEVAAAVRAARDRGVRVVLSADEVTHGALPAFRAIVAETVACASDGSRVLALWRPDGRGRLGSVSVVDTRFTTEDLERLRLALLPAPSAKAGYAVSLTADEDAVLIDLREDHVQVSGLR